MGGSSLEVMNPSHTRGLLRWRNRNTTQRLRIKLPPPSMQGGRPAGCRGIWDIPSQLELKWEAAPQLPTLSTLNVSRWGKSERNLIPPGAGREVFAQDKGNWLILFCFEFNPEAIFS